MPNIAILDLPEAFELDKEALSKLLGGRSCSGSWTKVIGSPFTGKRKKNGRHFFSQKKITYRQYQCSFRDYDRYQWIRC